MSRIEIDCPTCDGVGAVPPSDRPHPLSTIDWPTCPDCAGGGSILVERRISQPMAIVAWAFAMLIAVLVLIWAQSMIAPTVAAADDAAIGTATGAVRGVATWYDAPTRRDAAAGPVLREALGSDWRGRWVTVESGGRAVLVRLTDWCACGDRPGGPTVIDLDLDTFARLAPLSKGVVDVVVSWESGPTPTLPPTDVAADVSALAYAAADTLPVWRRPVIALLALAFMGAVAYAVYARSESR